MSNARRIALAMVSVAAAIFFCGAAVAWGGLSLPVVPLPPPTGNDAVGTSVLRLANGIPVQIWYPAAPGSGGPRAPYRLGMTGGSVRTRLTAALVRTNAAVDLPVADGKHPILIYVPGWGGARSDNTALAQNLASHGFIVVAMDDLYPARPMDFSSASAYRDTLRWAPAKVRLQAGAALDVLAAVDRLAITVRQSRFAGHVDISRAGMFGFSFGGAVAAEAATIDPRIRAAADLDGWTFGDAAERGVPRPFLIAATADDEGSDGGGSADPENTFTQLLDRTNLKQILDGFRRHGGFLLSIRGTGHYNFADLSLLPSIRHTEVGPIDAWRAQSIIGAYVSQFFDRYLNAHEAPLLEADVRSGTSRTFRSRMDPAASIVIWGSPQISIRPATATRPASPAS